jgi:hypothetical protein
MLIKTIEKENHFKKINDLLSQFSEKFESISRPILDRHQGMEDCREKESENEVDSITQTHIASFSLSVSLSPLSLCLSLSLSHLSSSPPSFFVFLADLGSSSSSGRKILRKNSLLL